MHHYSKDKIAQAATLKRSFESGYTRAKAEGLELTDLSWDEFVQCMRADVESNTTHNTLAGYALSEARTLVMAIGSATLKTMPADDLRQLLHRNVAHVLAAPTGMTDEGIKAFIDYMDPDENVMVYQHKDETRFAWTRFDFDYYTSEYTGCPAIELPVSSRFPSAEGNQADHFLHQFFHTVVDVVMNDAERTVNAISSQGQY